MVLFCSLILFCEVNFLHQALYRKWRPQVFDDVHGQDHITSVLKYEVDKSKFSHAYLFCGSRGTGKTTCAKILAKAVNCESPVNGNPCNKCSSCLAIDSGSATDVLEMDAASNNGVDNIRDIRDEVVYLPSLLKYRVYIVDEVHMLSGSAFNALLKTLEEPPSHVIFILATTELHKLPATIVSRCQRFDFRRITVSDIMSRLTYISQKENIKADNDALRTIAKYAQGGMRDAISLFELCAGNRDSLSSSDVTDTIGTISTEMVANVLEAVRNKDYNTIFTTIDEIIKSSKDISVFLDDIISYCRNMLVCKTTNKPEAFFDLTEVEIKQLKTLADKFTCETILYFIKLLNDASYVMLKSGMNKRNIAETTLIRMTDSSLDTSMDAVLSRLATLEAIATTNSFASVAAPGDNSLKAMVQDKPVASSKPLNENKIEPPLSNNSGDQKTKGEKFLRGWLEMIDKISSSDTAVAPLLRMSKAYLLPDGRISIRFQNQFAMDMFLASKLKPLLYSSLNTRFDKVFSESEIEVKVVTDLSDETDDLDTIIQ